MEKDSRRGFLKTLGKLTAAVGLTAAAASTLEAKTPTTPKAKFASSLESTSQKSGDYAKWVQDGRQVKNFTPPGGTPIIEDLTYKTAPAFSKTMERVKPGSLIPTESYVHPGYTYRTYEDHEKNILAQRTMNSIYNAHLDNMAMELHPPQMVVPRHIYDFVQTKEAIQKLDPYNWGAVFELRWLDWTAADPAHATVTGRWMAKVRPEFHGVFDNEIEYYQSQSIAMEYLVSVAQNHERIKEAAKDQCFRQLVDRLQGVILERIARDVKDQPVQMTNVCLTSSRDAATLKGITD